VLFPVPPPPMRRLGPARGSRHQPVCRLAARLRAYSSHPALPRDLSAPLATEYHPAAVEAAWYEWWEQRGLFQPPLAAPGEAARPPFSMVLPPPNVTGVLHIGHALTVAIQDTLARW
jgi:valyl-tRNA synthetase